MPRLHGGPRTMDCGRDSEGYRTYKVSHLVEVVAGTSVYEGPASALRCPGLPTFGAAWAFGADLDVWAWCRWDASVKPHGTSEDRGPPRFYSVEQTFSSKPPEGKEGKKCQDTQVEDPLLQPPKLSGSFVSKSVEATHDRYGRPIQYSSFETIRGSQVEFEDNLPVVKIEQNVLDLELPLVTSMRRSVNDRTLWGVPKRCVRLKSFTWSQNFYGVCYRYYTRNFEWEVNWDTFDRDVLNESQLVLSGHWNQAAGTDEWVLENIGGVAPDPLNPRHYNRYLDRAGQPGRVLLDVKTGQPLKKVTDGTVLVNTTNLPTVASNYTPAGQPTLPAVLKVVVTDADASAYCSVQCVGTGYGGRTEVETIFLGSNPANEYFTKAAFNTVELFTVDNIAGVQAGTDKFKITAQDGTPSAGKVRVEYYVPTNYLLLGIPAIL